MEGTEAEIAGHSPFWLARTPRSFTCDDLGLDELILDDPPRLLGEDLMLLPSQAQAQYSGPGTQMCPVEDFEPDYDARLPLEPPQELGDETTVAHGNEYVNSAAKHEPFGAPGQASL